MNRSQDAAACHAGERRELRRKVSVYEKKQIYHKNLICLLSASGLALPSVFLPYGPGAGSGIGSDEKPLREKGRDCPYRPRSGFLLLFTTI